MATSKKPKQLTPEQIAEQIQPETVVSDAPEVIEAPAELPEAKEEVKAATLVGKVIPMTAGKPAHKEGTVTLRHKVTGKIICQAMPLQRAKKQVRDFPNVVEIV